MDIAKKTLAPQTKITIVMRNGITVQRDLERMRAVDDRADARSGAPRRYFTAKTTISPAISSEKNTAIGEQEEVQRVDAGGHRRRLLGKERSAGPHSDGAACRLRVLGAGARAGAVPVPARGVAPCAA